VGGKEESRSEEVATDLDRQRRLAAFGQAA